MMRDVLARVVMRVVVSGAVVRGSDGLCTVVLLRKEQQGQKGAKKWYNEGSTEKHV